MKRKLTFLAAAVTAVSMLIASCGAGDTEGLSMDKETLEKLKVDPELVKNTVNATIYLEDGDEIELELYPDLAPETVENFVMLAEDGFYDGTIFHRVIEDFMIQGGGYDENLKKQNADAVKGEFEANGFENTLSHVRGVISMARARDMNSATSQFFIVQQDSPHLDGQYAAFGRVTDGMDVVDDIASVRTGYVEAQGMDDVPVDPIVIDTIEITSGGSKNVDSGDKDSDDDKPSKSSSKSTPKPASSATSKPIVSSPRPLNPTDNDDEFDDEYDEEYDDDIPNDRSDIADEDGIARGDLRDLLT